MLRPVLWFANKFSSRPVPERISKSLSELKEQIEKQPGKKGPLIPFNAENGRVIVFSDQHKGAKNGADDFMLCEPNYLAALDYYEEKEFYFISLGDNDELWENRWPAVKKIMLQLLKRKKNSFSEMLSSKYLATMTWHGTLT